MKNLLAQDFKFGSIAAPLGVTQYGDSQQGLILLLNNILKIIIFASGLVAMVNFLVSGIQLIGSSGNPDYVKQASNRIWYSLLGLLIVAGSLAVAAVIGLIFFGDAKAIIIPTFPGD